jgi:hypothetical protein
MLVGHSGEGGGPGGTLARHAGRPLRQVDDLGRLLHDDMTIQRGRTFNWFRGSLSPDHPR